MSLIITPDSPLRPEVLALLAESQRALEAVFAPEDIFSFSPDELAGPEVVFLVARTEAGEAVGCIALVACEGYGEIKRLYTREGARGRGTARALMAALEHTARERGLGEVRLETGPPLTAALRLYESLGYRRRGPFGDYSDNPASLFMAKALP